MELEADPNVTKNANESWRFVRRGIDGKMIDVVAVDLRAGPTQLRPSTFWPPRLGLRLEPEQGERRSALGPAVLEPPSCLAIWRLEATLMRKM